MPAKGNITPVPFLGTITVSRAPHPPVLLVEVQRGARVVHGRVLARLDGQAQVLGRQVAQRALLGPPPGRRRAHERREARRVAHVLARVAQLQRLRAGWSEPAAGHAYAEWRSFTAPGFGAWGGGSQPEPCSRRGARLRRFPSSLLLQYATNHIT